MSQLKKELRYEGRVLHYRVYGTGRPVILVHGFGEEANVWDGLVAHLQDRYQLIVPDLPGSGDSALVPDMSIEGMAETIHEIVHAEGFHTCTLIGHSMGGYITLAFAEKYWNHLDAFGLFHSTSYADSAEKIATRRKGIAFIREHGAFEFLKAATPNLFSPKTKEENTALVEKQIAGLSRFTPEALITYYEAMIGRPDRTEVLRQTHVPVLFIIGKSDNAVSPDDSLQQSHLPEISYIHLLPHSGHMGMLEEPEACNRILDEFLLETEKY
jgi:pimeloyl-ACP methyl ester carboxylesterase